MDTRIKELWTVEEQKMVKDYHAAVEHLEEERMKHKKVCTLDSLLLSVL